MAPKKEKEGHELQSQLPIFLRMSQNLPSHLIALELSGSDKLNGLILLQNQLIFGLLGGSISGPKLQGCCPQPGLLPAPLLLPRGAGFFLHDIHSSCWLWRGSWEDRGCLPLCPIPSSPVTTPALWERQDKDWASQGTAHCLSLPSAWGPGLKQTLFRLTCPRVSSGMW